MRFLFPALLLSSQSFAFVFGQNVSNDLMSAQRLSEAASVGKLDELRAFALAKQDPMARLIAAYLLYKLDPDANRNLFTRSFPTTKSGLSRFMRLHQSIPYSEKEEGNEYRHPKSKWTIGFWSIYHAYLERVKAGDSEAIRRFLQLNGLGDGEVGEGIGSDITELFCNPSFALAHWKTLEPHKQFLRAVQGWATTEQFTEIRRGYDEALARSDPRRAIILRLLDNPE